MENEAIWLKIQEKADLMTVASALLKNGYIVRICRKKENGKLISYVVAAGLEGKRSEPATSAARPL